MLDIEKNLTSANKCVVGKTYYLSGIWWDYGNTVPLGILTALGVDCKPLNHIKPKTLLNTPVKYIGRNFKGRTASGDRATFVLELPDKTLLYTRGDSKDIFKEKHYDKIH